MGAVKDRRRFRGGGAGDEGEVISIWQKPFVQGVRSAVPKLDVNRQLTFGPPAAREVVGRVDSTVWQERDRSPRFALHAHYRPGARKLRRMLCALTLNKFKPKESGNPNSRDEEKKMGQEAQGGVCVRMRIRILVGGGVDSRSPPAFYGEGKSRVVPKVAMLPYI